MIKESVETKGKFIQIRNIVIYTEHWQRIVRKSIVRDVNKKTASIAKCCRSDGRLGRRKCAYYCRHSGGTAIDAPMLPKIELDGKSDIRNASMVEN